MRREFLKRYNVTLETIGPVHVGSGKQINKKEYVLDTEKKLAYILDEQKLFSCLIQKDLLNSFEMFMVKEKGTLFSWMSENRLLNDLDSITKYTLDCDAVAELNTRKNVFTFIKDGYGRPYVPGSSIKGALRNVLLSKLASDCRKEEITSSIVKTGREKLNKPKKKYMKKESSDLNEWYFHTLNRPETKKKDAVNDIMSGLRVSDSMSLGFDCLTLCQKVDFCTENKGKNMPLVRECIKPGAVIECEMVIDTTILNIDIDFIKEAIREFLDNYNEEFLSKFEEEVLYRDNVIYLGGGVGYHSKTVTSTILENKEDKVGIVANIINNTINPRDRGKHKHDNDKNLGVSPHIVKLTEYDRDLLQFGPCRISFEEL